MSPVFQSPDWRWTTVNANLLFKWRQQWRQGKVKLPSEYETSAPLLIPVTLESKPVPETPPVIRPTEPETLRVTCEVTFRHGKLMLKGDVSEKLLSTQTATAEEALKRIGELYAVEEEIRGLPATERLAARRTRSKLVLISLHDWLVDKRATLSKKSRPGKAFAYVLNQWDALCYYCDDGLAEPDNNAAERVLRAVCPGKKNYIFFGSDHGGERGALLYGLSGTCRLNGIAPEAYLRHILRVLPEWPSNKVAELLPWNVALTNK